MKKRVLSVRAMELVKLGKELEKTDHADTCLLCWKSGCNCNKSSVKDDLFLNLTESYEYI